MICWRQRKIGDVFFKAAFTSSLFFFVGPLLNVKEDASYYPEYHQSYGVVSASVRFME
jgi:hypothetical protein